MIFQVKELGGVSSLPRKRKYNTRADGLTSGEPPRNWLLGRPY